MNITKIDNTYKPKQINFYNRRSAVNAANNRTADKFVKNSRQWISDALALLEDTLPKKRIYTQSDYRIIGLHDYINKNKQIFINMLNFENLSDSDQAETFNFIHNQVQQTKKRIREERHINNFLGSLRNIFSSQIIRNKGEAEYYKEEGVYLFIKENLNNFKSFLDSIPPYKLNSFKDTLPKTADFPTPPIKMPKSEEEITRVIKTPVKTAIVTPHVEPAVVKPHWQEYNELKAESDKFYNEYMALDPSSDRSEAKEKMRKASIAAREFREKAKKENFSLLEKKDLSLASEDERWEYFIKYAFPLMENNEATALDCLEMFDKFGMRRYVKRSSKDTMPGTSLGQLMMNTPDRPSDKFISKMLDVIDKYTVPNTAVDCNDVDMLRYILMNSSEYHLSDNISEDSLLKAIDLFKKMEFWKTKTWQIPNDIKMRYIDRKFKDSPRLDEIKGAVKELENLWNINNPEQTIK